MSNAWRESGYHVIWKQDIRKAGNQSVALRGRIGDSLRVHRVNSWLGVFVAMRQLCKTKPIRALTAENAEFAEETGK